MSDMFILLFMIVPNVNAYLTYNGKKSIYMLNLNNSTECAQA
jgi:hypothetical protein